MQLQQATSGIGGQRFRPFLVFVGEPPGAPLLAAVASASPNWYVAHLGSQAASDISENFPALSEGRAYGFVFAQRRLIWDFDPQAPPNTWAADLLAHARYAHSLLGSLYADVDTSNDPDSPKGRLWLAPGRLTAEVGMGLAKLPDATRLCFLASDGEQMADSLVGVTAGDARGVRRTRWARTSSDGCVALRGLPSSVEARLEVYRVLAAETTFRLDARAADRGQRVEFYVE